MLNVLNNDSNVSSGYTILPSSSLVLCSPLALPFFLFYVFNFFFAVFLIISSMFAMKYNYTKLHLRHLIPPYPTKHVLLLTSS